MRVQGYAARDARSPLEPFEFERRALRATDVQIEIDHCGICHTDIHIARNDWGFSQFPCVPGHEIVGRVVAVGPGVSRHSVGDRVGVGCFVASCGECDSCRAGQENYCEKGVVYTYSAVDADGSITQGGYSTGIVVDEHFVFGIPDNLDMASAAPLLCAGITTYSPLRTLQVGRGDTVAVMGLGGLGHMAVQYAAAMGAEVTVLSRSPEKARDAVKLGAHDFVNTRDGDALQKHAGRFRYIMDTLAVEHDLTGPLTCLQRDGTLVMLGVPPGPVSVLPLPLVFARRRIMGSLVGGVPETQEMLDFSAAHGITCEIEEIGPADINDAYERTLRGDVKYRFVIDCQQMRQPAQQVALPVAG
jgi:alcohol dehydrogenase (NADP+)